jgi:hypothetical protein
MVSDLLELRRAEQRSVYGQITHKRCPRCYRWLPVEAFRVQPCRSKREPWRRWKLSSYCRECMADATRRWREANRERINARRRAEYAVARGPLPHCSECDAELESHAKVVCSRRCKGKRYARLHPDKVREKERRKAARRRERRRAA